MSTIISAAHLLPALMTICSFCTVPGSESHMGTIVGAIVGVVLVFLLLIIGLLWHLIRTRRRATRASVWFDPRASHGATSMLLDRSTSNTSSLFFSADGGVDKGSMNENNQAAPTYRYGATSLAFVASTHSLVNSTQPFATPAQPESLPMLYSTQPLIAATTAPQPANTSTQSLVTSARLVVSPPLRSADIRVQDPDPFSDRSRPDTMVSVESPTIHVPLPNPFQDPALFPPEGRVAAWESQMHSARNSISGLQVHTANLEVARGSLLSDASIESLVEVSCSMHHPKG